MKRSIPVLFLILAACAPSKPGAVLPEFISPATPYIGESYPTAQADVRVSSQDVSGIQVEVRRAWQDGKDLNAEVCFSLPDSSDWSIWSASLNYAGTVMQEYGTTLISVQDAANGSPGLRCDTLTFVVAPDADLSSASIAIGSIAAYPREGEYCSVYMPKIQQALLARGIGITLECQDVNGAALMQITNRPPEMTQEQAEEIVYSDEYYSIKGPWTFALNLAQ